MVTPGHIHKASRRVASPHSGEPVSETYSDSIVDLQSRISYQEDMIGNLDQQVAKQGEDIALLHQHIALLNKKFNQLMLSGYQQKPGADGLEDERPPHY